jgi:hypothetical protein
LPSQLLGRRRWKQQPVLWKPTSATKMLGERQRGGDAGGRQLVAKGRGGQQGQATNVLAKMPARKVPMPLLEGGGGGRRLALAGRRLGTRCVPVHELVGRRDRLLGADAGLVSWSSPSGAPPDGVRPALDGAETFAASALWGTSRSPRQTQLTESVECWTRRLPSWRQWGH